MKNKKNLAIFAGTVLLLNGVMITVDTPKNSYAIAEENIPADEDIPDSQQLKLIKDAERIISELEEVKNNDDKKEAGEIIDYDAESLNAISKITNKNKRSALISRYNAILTWLGKSPLVDPTPPTGDLYENRKIYVKEDVDFEIKTVEDITLEKGKVYIQQEGQKGQDAVEYETVFKNGEEQKDSRKEVKRTRIIEPIYEIKLIGAKEDTIAPAITIKEEVQTVKVPYNKVKKEDSNLEKGKTRVERGVEGATKVTYTVTYKDGKETSRTETRREVEVAPVDEVIYVGTKEIPEKIEIRQFTENKEIEFKELEEKDLTLEKGKKVEKTAGKKGILTTTYEAEFKNEKEIPGTRKKVKEEQTTAPVNRVVLVGTKEKSINPTPTTPVVTTKEEVQTVKVPYNKVKKEDSNLEKEKTRVERGVEGTAKVIYTVTYKDGKETSRTETKREVEVAPVDEVTYMGIKEKENIEKIKATGTEVSNSRILKKIDSKVLPNTGIEVNSNILAGIVVFLTAGVLVALRRKDKQK
ncbi:G5 domain-containing protein [Gemella cuniculi]|uniref:G5 domain-containing protein n=1 Tax=Gemella cuniculi TaxID=150240 RepID=UPI000425D84C|nr:G5 domain-containing protein [Gemella cuniculi]